MSRLARHRFNPRARTGRDSAAAWWAMECRQFQPTRPHGARLSPEVAQLANRAFQPTRPHGARLDVARLQDQGLMFQPTRPHGARPAAGPLNPGAANVSTHAPARGATMLVKSRISDHDAFQPTRPHGARLFGSGGRPQGILFQPTRPHGARQPIVTRSASVTVSFNPRARTGRDRGAPRVLTRWPGFNPRARTGRDRRGGRPPSHGPVSTHAPARGATAPL